jgi:hypothetical protein
MDKTTSSDHQNCHFIGNPEIQGEKNLWGVVVTFGSIEGNSFFNDANK